ncbi:hypothetical protein Cob_v006024 [Colletotrichum orbiculare MAFF 240422]|uniref:Uncharacterized protein n=1 Tax=Colletotrichum orbiculare (strain 104-T / ATCC 96160 / CBS 514.97 / LARS 414 / MAFF 240422) TaxID=1213857 RepID=A0A484FTV8_COLOR|nr:hypothetical protein Cob_v006024 [Colletotrichum orbiculare MAFF 240422]
MISTRDDPRSPIIPPALPGLARTSTAERILHTDGTGKISQTLGQRFLPRRSSKCRSVILVAEEDYDLPGQIKTEDFPDTDLGLEEHWYANDYDRVRLDYLSIDTQVIPTDTYKDRTIDWPRCNRVIAARIIVPAKCIGWTEFDMEWHSEWHSECQIRVVHCSITIQQAWKAHDVRATSTLADHGQARTS